MSYTAQDVKELSVTLGIGIHEAKLKLDKLDMLQQINDAKTINDIKPILLKLVEYVI